MTTKVGSLVLCVRAHTHTLDGGGTKKRRFRFIIRRQLERILTPNWFSEARENNWG